jgi:hypothetical protein
VDLLELPDFETWEKRRLGYVREIVDEEVKRWEEA